MKKTQFPSRQNYESTNESLGLDFGMVDNKKYWAENTAYEFSISEVNQIEKATEDLHQMCFNAIDHIISKNLFHKLNIPKHMIGLIKKSWEDEDWSMYGRFDFCVKNGTVKMLEYNADTPTSLLESSVIQHVWMKENELDDQFNSIEEKLVAWWEAYKEEHEVENVHFTAVKENTEDYRNVEYIMECAEKAGITTKFLFIEDLGTDEEYLYDLENEPIECLFKLYPWEWLAQEDNKYISVLEKGNCSIIEPAWKMLLSNKAILAILWEMYPHHENLLETYFEPSKLGNSYVKKPFLSREGQNVEIFNGLNSEKKDGFYKSDFCVYQKYFELPKFDENYVVIGSWIIGEEAAGMGIRQDSTKITANASQFCPHYIKEDIRKGLKNNFYKNMNSSIKEEDEEIKIESKTDLVKAGLAIIAGGFCWFVYNAQNESIEASNKPIIEYNKKQTEALYSIISKDKKAETLNWIDSLVDDKNREVFKTLYTLNRSLVSEGVDRNKFNEIEKAMSNAVFCVQGEKDTNLLQDFLENKIYDTEIHKKTIIGLKKFHGSNPEKYKIPTEEEILELCNFKNFEKDLMNESKKHNDQTTDKDKKVVVEDGE